MHATSTTVIAPSYPPLTEIRKTLRVKWYRCSVDRQRLRELSARSDKQGWIQVGGHLGVYLALAILSIVLWAQQAWVGLLLSLWFLGIVATFFKGTAAHELGHGTVFNTRALNVWFLHIVSLISWWDPYDYGASHTYHHRYTTHPEGDRENILPLTPSLAPNLLVELFTLNLFAKPSRNFGKGGFFWAVYLTWRSALGKPSSHIEIPSQEWLSKLHAEHPQAFKKSVHWSRVLIAFHSMVLLVSVITGWWILVLVITMPSFIANIVSYLVGTTQHCGLIENSSDFRKNARSIKLNPVLSFFYWHMNWHIEHHMYAGVPCYNLKALAAEIEADMPEPRSLFEAWKEMRNTWRTQQSNPGYAFDTQVPAPTSKKSTPIDDDLANCIGDLAPKGSDIG